MDSGRSASDRATTDVTSRKSPVVQLPADACGIRSSTTVSPPLIVSFTEPSGLLSAVAAPFSHIRFQSTVTTS
jgi:hypothetical protein